MNVTPTNNTIKVIFIRMRALPSGPLLYISGKKIQTKEVTILDSNFFVKRDNALGCGPDSFYG